MATQQGGAARAALRLHDGLCKQNADSLVYAKDAKDGQDSRVYGFRAERDLISRVKVRLRKVCIDRAYQAYTGSRPGGLDIYTDDRAEYGEQVVRQMPQGDIVHLHWIAQFVDYSSFFRSIRQPIVWTLHDMNAFTGGCHYTVDCEKFYDACGACPQLGSSRQNDLAHAIWKRKAAVFSKLRAGQMHIVATSQWMRKEAQASTLLAHCPITVIPLGLDTEMFAPRDGDGMKSTLGIPKKAKVICFAADAITDRRKGFAELLQALESLALDEEIFFLTTGRGKPDLGSKFNHLHIGYVGSDRLLASMYSASDVFVIPSLQEAFGQTALEAMACGTPVVGFDVGGIPDMVRPGITGLLACRGDIAGLRSSIFQLLSDSGKQSEMAINCRRIVEEEYGLNIQACRYMGVYEKMLGNNISVSSAG